MISLLLDVSASFKSIQRHVHSQLSELLTLQLAAKYSTVYEDQMTPRALDIPGGRRAVEITSRYFTLFFTFM